MFFKNIKNNQIASIESLSLIQNYKKDSNWIELTNYITQKNDIDLLKVKDIEKITNIKYKLSKISEDIIQSQVGEVVPNIEEKKKQFITLHNELRILEGKEKRELINNI